MDNVRYADETGAGEELQRIAERSGVGAMPLRALSALLFLGGILYALLSGNRGIGTIAFGLGAVVLGLDRLRVARGRPERAIGWVLVLAFCIVAETLREVPFPCNRTPC